MRMPAVALLLWSTTAPAQIDVSILRPVAYQPGPVAYFDAPLGYALFTSIGGFSQPNALDVSASVDKNNFDEIEHVVTLPATAAFSAIRAPLEIRIYAFGAQFDGHATSMTAFKLTSAVAKGGRHRAVH